MALDKENLVWIDLEMTGLDPNKNTIIEIATIVTDKHLNVLAEGPSLAIYQPQEVMDGMDEWCTSHHAQSGLTDRVLTSVISMEQAEEATIAFLSNYVGKGESPICGNSVGQDRRFLYEYMPALEAFFHYRYLDVSTVKELARRWQPELLNKYTKKGAHLAMDDIKDSIAELVFYREHFFDFTSAKINKDG